MTMLNDKCSFILCDRNILRWSFWIFSYLVGVAVTCEKCYLTMRKVPGEDYNYSDHEGVAAVYSIKKNITGQPAFLPFTTRCLMLT